MSLLLHHTIYALRILRWAEGYCTAAIVSILAWTFICLHTQSTLTILLPVAVIIYMFHPIPTTLSLTFETLNEELSYFKFPQFNRSPARLVFYWAMWNMSMYVLGTRYHIWVCGIFVFLRNSHHWQVIRYHRAVFHANPVVQEPMIISEQVDRCYHFKLIEYQRWWIHRGWTCMLLPNERPKWSDEYLMPVPSIHEFKLPEPIVKLDPKTNQLNTMTWEWAQDEGKTEHWEYGNWDWKNWSSNSTGLSRLTRRRHWIRNARLMRRRRRNVLNILLRLLFRTRMTISGYTDNLFIYNFKDPKIIDCGRF